MIRFRDAIAKRFDLDLRVHTNPDGLRQNINPFDHGSNVYTQVMKTDALKQALTEGRFDVAIGGARRDEERSRAKERVFSVRGPGHSWMPSGSGRNSGTWTTAIWFRARRYGCSRCPTGPNSTCGPTSWPRASTSVPLYFAAPRPTVERDGLIIVVDDDRMQFRPGERPVERVVRFRSLGCYPLSAAVTSSAASLDEIVAEMRTTESWSAPVG